MKERAAIVNRFSAAVLLLSLFLSGCSSLYTPIAIYPSSQLSPTYFGQVPHVQHDVTLILTPGYRDRKIKQRTSSLTSKREYHLGQALNPLTVAYFRESFHTALVLDQSPVKGRFPKVDYFIEPRVDDFRIDFVNYNSAQQAVVTMQAIIYGPDMTKRYTATSQTIMRHSISMLHGETDSERFVSHALQQALVDLIRRIEDIFWEAEKAAMT